MNASTLITNLLIYLAPTLYVVAMLTASYWVANGQERQRQAGTH